MYINLFKAACKHAMSQCTYKVIQCMGKCNTMYGGKVIECMGKSNTMYRLNCSCQQNSWCVICVLEHVYM